MQRGLQRAAAKSRCKRDEDGCPPRSAKSDCRRWAQPTLHQNTGINREANPALPSEFRFL